MASKYGIGQEAQWLSSNIHLLIGRLDEGKWSWTQHPLPHKAKANLRESGLFRRTEDGQWVLDEAVIDAALEMAQARGYDVDDVFAD